MQLRSLTIIHRDGGALAKDEPEVGEQMDLIHLHSEDGPRGRLWIGPQITLFVLAMLNPIPGLVQQPHSEFLPPVRQLQETLRHHQFHRHRDIPHATYSVNSTRSCVPTQTVSQIFASFVAVSQAAVLFAQHPGCLEGVQSCTGKRIPAVGQKNIQI